MRTSLMFVVFAVATCIASVAYAEEIEAWPTVAINQFEAVDESPIESTPDTTLICEPCFDVCPGWETVANAVCRAQEVGRDCEEGFYNQSCVWKFLSSGLKTCQTCIN